MKVVAILTVAVFLCIHEIWVLDRAMVRHKVHHDLDAPLVALIDQRLEILFCTEMRIHLIEILYMIAMIICSFEEWR